MPANAVHEIKIEGFKSIRSLSLELKPINVVIGANGSGKSNFIEVFAFLRAIGQGWQKIYVDAAGGAEKILYFGSKTTKNIEIRVSFSNGNTGGASVYDLTLAPSGVDRLFPSSEEIYWGDELTSMTNWQQERETGISNTASGSKAEWFRKRFDLWHPYHLHGPSSMRQTAKVHDNRFLRPDGSNLPAILYYLRERHSDSYRLIVRAVAQVAPFFEDFELSPLQLNPDGIRLQWRHKGSDQYFDASQMSDGTLRFIVLAVLFLQPLQYRSSLILIDEPELGLHPYAVGLLAALIRQASVDTQVIVSTQSPLLLDYFDPEEVLVADRIDGATQLRRLQSAQLEDWLKDYSLGQLWEKNEFGGRPAPG